ncbi:hypothetical protein, partial [Endozoicomonas sp. YOMI1]|uniref:hypothetical protein n=1 Tax=Endozoicomonas sp. YOMI1 TaxID=2828739 RepID=UPI0021496F31
MAGQIVFSPTPKQAQTCLPASSPRGEGYRTEPTRLPQLRQSDKTRTVTTYNTPPWKQGNDCIIATKR